MTTVAAKTPTRAPSAADPLERLVQRLAAMKLSAAVFLRDGALLHSYEHPCEFCLTLRERSGICQDARNELAERTIVQNKPAIASVAPACCMIGLPLQRRRRSIGALVACFPTAELADMSHLAKLCDRLQLDLEFTYKQLRLATHYNPDQADALSEQIGWLAQDAVALDTSNSETAELSANLARSYEQLSLLYRVSGKAQIIQQPRDFMRQVGQELLDGLGVEAAAAMVFAHPPSIPDDLVIFEGQSDVDEAGVVAIVRRHVLPYLDEASPAILRNRFSHHSAPGIRNILAVPLQADRLMGVLVAFNKLDGEFESLDIKLIDAIGAQAAAFIGNHRLYADLQDLLGGVLYALSAAIDAKDAYTSGHSRRVALISKRLSEISGLTPRKVQEIYLAGLLHDIGKIGVPEQTLAKSGSLTDSEYAQIKRHPIIGATILGGIRQLDRVIPGILNHHERPDGRGYPRGLKADQIPIEGSIVGLADGLDAMTSDRTYRRCLSLEAVIQEITANAGSQFDGMIVDRLMSMNLAAFLKEIRDPGPIEADLDFGQLLRQ